MIDRVTIKPYCGTILKVETLVIKSTIMPIDKVLNFSINGDGCRVSNEEN